MSGDRKITAEAEMYSAKFSQVHCWSFLNQKSLRNEMEKQ